MSCKVRRVSFAIAIAALRERKLLSNPPDEVRTSARLKVKNSTNSSRALPLSLVNFEGNRGTNHHRSRFIENQREGLVLKLCDCGRP